MSADAQLTSPSRAKIGVVGCGALGSYYGGRLARVGHEVHFLLRSDFDVVRERGVSVQSVDGDFHFKPHCARAPEQIGICDWVILGLKTTANREFARLLPPLVGPHTAILTLQNGLGNEEALAELFPASQILGGLCFVCLNRLEPGRIQHIAHGRVVVGEFQRSPEPRTHQFASWLQQSGVPCDVTEALALAHWEKLVWNIPFNGLGVASSAGWEAVATGCLLPHASLQPCLTTDLLLREARWERLVRELMREVIATANAAGLGVDPECEKTQVNRTREMGPYRASTLIDFERGQPMELEALFLEPLRVAQQHHVPVPRLEALCQVLQQLDQAT